MEIFNKDAIVIRVILVKQQNMIVNALIFYHRNQKWFKNVNLKFINAFVKL